jgi:hypothetical protein
METDMKDFGRRAGGEAPQFGPGGFGPVFSELGAVVAATVVLGLAFVILSLAAGVDSFSRRFAMRLVSFILFSVIALGSSAPSAVASTPGFARWGLGHGGGFANRGGFVRNNILGCQNPKQILPECEVPIELIPRRFRGEGR